METLWKVGKAGAFVCAPIVAGDRIYIGATNGELAAIDLRGHVRQTLRLGLSALPSTDPGPVALNAGDGVVVLTTLTRLVVFR